MFTAGCRTIKSLSTHVGADNQIVVGGSCQTAANDLDYFVIKYRPDGSSPWQYRHPSALNDEMRAMTLESGTNVVVTGSSVSVKIGGSGQKSWELPMPGRDIAADESAIYIAGFSDTKQSIAKFNHNGQLDWSRTNLFTRSLKDVTQKLAVDSAGSIYIAGMTQYPYTPKEGPDWALSV